MSDGYLSSDMWLVSWWTVLQSILTCDQCHGEYKGSDSQNSATIRGCLPGCCLTYTVSCGFSFANCTIWPFIYSLRTNRNVYIDVYIVSCCKRALALNMSVSTSAIPRIAIPRIAIPRVGYQIYLPKYWYWVLAMLQINISNQNFGWTAPIFGLNYNTTQVWWLR